MATTKIIRDSGWSRAVKKLFRGYEVTVGIHEKEGARDAGGITNADAGFFNEFGTSRIPERSFLRSTFDKGSKVYKDTSKEAAAFVVRTGASLDKALAILGLKVSSDVKEAIRSRIDPPNAPSTIAKKGSSTPLIDTGQLLNSIDFEVKRRGV